RLQTRPHPEPAETDRMTRSSAGCRSWPFQITTDCAAANYLMVNRQSCAVWPEGLWRDLRTLPAPALAEQRITVAPSPSPQRKAGGEASAEACSKSAARARKQSGWPVRELICN